jgi:hypothetical protein
MKVARRRRDEAVEVGIDQSKLVLAAVKAA